MTGYYDRSGVPMEMMAWARAFEAGEDRRIGRTKITDAADPSKSFDVSTVWLGLDHSFGAGPPLIFETMVFAEGSSLDEYCERYSTEEQARAGHTAMVVTVAATLTDPVVMDPS